MADQFLCKSRISAEDFVDTGGRPVLERHAELRTLLADRAGPGAAALFAEPLISRGNDTAPATVSWYGDNAGEPRTLASLSALERDRAEAYLADHLRPLRALASDPDTADLVLGALSVLGGDDVLVVAGRPVIVNWGLLPGGKGANVAARPAHYAATLGRYLPLAGAVGAAPEPEPVLPVSAVGGAHSPAVAPGSDRRRLSPLAWVPLLILLSLAGLVLAWLLAPGTRLFHAPTPPAVTDADTLTAQRALNDALRDRRDALQAALEGAVCRPDGVLLLPDGLTPEGLTPPPVGVAPDAAGPAAPDALLPNRADRVLVPQADGDPATLLAWIEARTVLILARGAGGVAVGSGFVVSPGRVLTNQHVIAEAVGDGATILVTSKDMAQPQVAQVLKSQGPLAETGGDFALLAIADTSLPAFTLHRPDGSLKLSQVIAAGFPGDVLEMDVDFAALKSGDLAAVPDLTVTDGIVNAEQQIGPATRVLMHSAPLSTGNSGGPLVDMCGRVLGINSFVRKGRLQNRGYALPVAAMLAFLDDTGVAAQVTTEACAPLVARAPAAPQPDPAPEPAPDTPAQD